MSTRIVDKARKGRAALPGSAEDRGVQGEEVDRYRAVEVQARRDQVMRVVLWGAVALGVVGGVLSFINLSSSGSEAAAEVRDDGDSLMVPVQVAGFAEIAVEEWLMAGRDDAEQMRSLYLEPVESARASDDSLNVVRSRTVGGRTLEEGYWQVLVAVDVVEAGAPAGDGATASGAGEDDPDGEDAEPENPGFPGEFDDEVLFEEDVPVDAPRTEELAPTRDRWYLEVGIVGDEEGGLAAVRVPAVVENLPAPDEGRHAAGGSLTTNPDANDPLVELADSFLSAWLAGNGDPSRLVVAGGELEPVLPAPFEDISVQAMSVDELAADDVRMQVYVLATTAAGSQQVFAYELYAQESVSRWEIYNFSGAPVLTEGSSEAVQGEGVPDVGAGDANGPGDGVGDAASDGDSS